MNFLAHIYLSGENDLVKIGNFMADGIRGKNFQDFPDDVQKGIILHRWIDTYTDSHPVFRATTKKLHEHYHHYAGVVADVFYDHFLAKNWKLYSDEELEDFVARFYQSLRDHYDILSDKTKDMMPYLIKYNWLVSYRTVEGISRILSQMDHRTQNKSNMRFAATDLETHYASFESEFTEFFADIRLYSKEKLQSL